MNSRKNRWQVNSLTPPAKAKNADWKIAKNQHWILLYLNQLHVLDPHLLADGTKWTELKQPIELLMSMGNAVVECIQKNNKIVR